MSSQRYVAVSTQNMKFRNPDLRDYVLIPFMPPFIFYPWSIGVMERWKQR